MSQSESYESQSYDSSEEETEIVAKPVFVKRGKLQEKDKSIVGTETSTKSNPTISTNININPSSSIINTNTNPQPIDDSSEINEVDTSEDEQDFSAWKEREYSRYKRDMKDQEKHNI